MQIIQNQIISMAPIFVFILLGYIAGKAFKIKDFSIISKILLFIFTPVIAFNAIATADLSLSLLLLPVIFFSISSFLSVVSRAITRKIKSWDSQLPNVFSYSSGSGNVAFYGVPAAIILFGDKALPIVLVSMIGYIVYDSTIGYLIVSGRPFKLKEVALNLIKFPPFVAILIGLLFSLLNFNFSSITGYQYLVTNIQTSMATFGIFLVGLAVSKLKVKLDILYLILIVIQRIAVWPLIMLLVLYIDKLTINVLQDYALILILIATVPVATNSVILATTYTKHEDQAALGVMFTAVISLLSIPLWQFIVGEIL